MDGWGDNYNSYMEQCESWERGLQEQEEIDYDSEDLSSLGLLHYESEPLRQFAIEAHQERIQILKESLKYIVKLDRQYNRNSKKKKLAKMRQIFKHAEIIRTLEAARLTKFLNNTIKNTNTDDSIIYF